MVTVETIGRVRHAFLVKGKGIKQIARELRLSRNTVRTIVRCEETEHRYVRRTQPLPQLGAFAETLDRMLTANVVKPPPKRLTLQRIYRENFGSKGRPYRWLRFGAPLVIVRLFSEQLDDVCIRATGFERMR